MIPFRMKKDNVRHIVHSGSNRVAIADGTRPGQTLADPTGSRWPICWRCTEKALEERWLGGILGQETPWKHVEGYAILEEGKGYEVISFDCGHGGPLVGVYREDRGTRVVKRISVDPTWSLAKRAHKRGSLVVFTPEHSDPLANVVLM